MLYFPCPKCGGKVESIEANGLDSGNRHAGHVLRQQAMAGHPHPWMKAASMAFAIGRQIYKRVPGGGAKRCTKCGHEFN